MQTGRTHAVFFSPSPQNFPLSPSFLIFFQNILEHADRGELLANGPRCLFLSCCSKSHFVTSHRSFKKLLHVPTFVPRLLRPLWSRFPALLLTLGLCNCLCEYPTFSCARSSTLNSRQSVDHTEFRTSVALRLRACPFLL